LENVEGEVTSPIVKAGIDPNASEATQRTQRIEQLQDALAHTMSVLQSFLAFHDNDPPSEYYLRMVQQHCRVASSTALRIRLLMNEQTEPEVVTDETYDAVEQAVWGPIQHIADSREWFYVRASDGATFAIGMLHGSIMCNSCLMTLDNGKDDILTHECDLSWLYGADPSQ
jgi:hypothetical protein